ncbi:MAG TPA: multidrug transporter, partial [Phenylobacterium sp.]
MARLILPLSTAALLLAGCAAVPDLGAPPQVRPPQAYAATQSFAAAPAEWPADQWWKGYGDSQLDALVDEALAGSPTLVQAQARVRAAQAQAQQARAS